MEELNLQTISFNEICRFCISNPKTIELFSAPSIDALKYSEIAESLSDIPIFENDIYPKGLCDDCAQKLIDFQEFKLLIKNSYIDFDKFLIDRVKSEPKITSVEIEEDELNEHYEIEYDENITEICKIVKYESTLEIESSETNISTISESEFQPDESKQNRYISKSLLKSKKITSKLLPPDEQDKWHKKLNGWIKKQQLRNSPEEKINKIRPFICEVCGNSYTTIFSLRDHRHIHSGELNFPCDLCGKKFGTKKNLRSHIKYRHSECEMFYCDICGFAFNRRSNLNSHKWVHSENSRYSCEYCGKCFKWKNGFDIHVNSHLKTKTYHCYICNKVFYTPSSQIKHCKRYHDGHGRVPLEENFETNVITDEQLEQIIPNESVNELYFISDLGQNEDELQQMNFEDQNYIELTLTD